MGKCITLTKANYRKRVAQLEQEIDRCKAAGVSGERFLMHTIGNLHWEFGNLDEARACYERVLPLARKEADHPLPGVALILWRAGRMSEMEEECRAVLGYRRAQLPGLEAASPMSMSAPGGRELMLAYSDLAYAGFLLRDYPTAEEWSVKAKRLIESQPGDVEALRQLSASLKTRDGEAFATALRFLRNIAPPFAVDMNRDLYCVALALGREYFGSIPADLEAELLSSQPEESPKGSRKRGASKAAQA